MILIIILIISICYRLYSLTLRVVAVDPNVALNVARPRALLDSSALYASCQLDKGSKGPFGDQRALRALEGGGLSLIHI